MKCVNLFEKKGNNLQIMTTMVYGFKIIRCFTACQIEFKQKVGSQAKDYLAFNINA